MALARSSAIFLVATQLALAACTTTPMSERARIIEIPLAAVQSDVQFVLLKTSQPYLACAESLSCLDKPGQAADESFGQEAARIAGNLQTAALKLYPDLSWCTAKATGGCFAVQVVDDDEPGSSSSAGGQIALNGGLERWRGQEEALAFVIGREMGHVIARHHQERSSVSMVTSALLNVVIPGSGLLKSLVCSVGAHLAASSNRKVQAMEADAIATRLLKGAGYRLRNVSSSLLVTPPLGAENAWSKGFGRSAMALIAEAEAAETKVAAATSGAALGGRNGVAVDQ